MNIGSIHNRLTKLEAKAGINVTDVRLLTDAELDARIASMMREAVPYLAAIRVDFPEFETASDEDMLEVAIDNPDHPAFAEWER